MGENDMQGFGNTPRGSKFFDETMPKIAHELEVLNKRLGESMGIPKHILEKEDTVRGQIDPIALEDAPKYAARLATVIENKRTIGSILAGLRLLQQQITGDKYGVTDIATCASEVEPLTANEIDGLCDDLNSL